MSSYFALIKSLPSRVYRRYQKLHLYGKIILWLWLLFELCLVIAIFIITPKRVAQFMYDNVERLAARYPVGFVAGVSILTILISFPPLHGHTTATTLCGFAWGLKGFFVAAPASLIGALVVFSALRLVFKKRLSTLSKGNEKWQALEAVIAAKGLPLIILIRMSPLPPWVYSNTLFASIGSVSIWQFMVATCCVFPKIFLHVFIGSKVAALSDGEQRSHMDTHTIVINVLLIGGGIIIAILASWLVYTSVQTHIRNAAGVSPETDELAAEAFEDAEDAPLLVSDV
ncbi:Golgi apparatus membrane protein TVP38 [Mycena rosella]|uniref:Golgi apparatus membrane protein TVP38 n=1 Tax=Mycena rosella TaxID=1033263 RepID=A0AAD7GL00_MYCRO|nr:Golgi apparatus membrane protein TVP38 [Mycena rosella]